jgi:hypothetical protein
MIGSMLYGGGPCSAYLLTSPYLSVCTAVSTWNLQRGTIQNLSYTLQPYADHEFGGSRSPNSALNSAVYRLDFVRELCGLTREWGRNFMKSALYCFSIKGIIW